MNNPRAIRQNLLSIQENAGCNRFDANLKRVLTEWKRSLEEYERHAIFVKELIPPSDTLSSVSKDIALLLAKCLREILIFENLESHFSETRNCHISTEAISEYCVHFERIFFDANDLLMNNYNDLMMGRRNNAENSATLIRNSYTACHELLRSANVRLLNLLNQRFKNRKILNNLAFAGGNFFLWSVGVFYSRIYPVKFPMKMIIYAALFGASLWSYNALKSVCGSPMSANGRLKELDTFITNFV